jgi:SOS-response transcriptional repressor LexA
MQPTTAFCTIYPMADEEIGRRIAAERENKGISQSELARALGISPQAVQKWEDGGRPRFARLPTIADALGVDLRVLVRGTLYEAALQSADEIPDVNVARDRVRKKRLELIERNPGELIGKLPLISWEMAAEWLEKVEKIVPDDIEDWIQVPFEHGPKAFCIRIEGESNYDPAGVKSYAPGDFIAVDPMREATNRSMVVVRIDHESRATFKQLLVDGETKMLRALNPAWPNRLMEMPAGSQIIGVVIGKWVPE